MFTRESASDYVCLNFCLCRDITCAGNDNLIGGSYFITIVVMRCRHSTHSTHKSTPQPVAQGAKCRWCAIYIVVDSYCLPTLQADACSGGGCACYCCCRRPAICCLSVSCLSCRPSSIATPHQMLAAMVVMLIAVIALSSVKSSVVDSCCLPCK